MQNTWARTLKLLNHKITRAHFPILAYTSVFDKWNFFIVKFWEWFSYKYLIHTHLGKSSLKLLIGETVCRETVTYRTWGSVTGAALSMGHLACPCMQTKELAPCRCWGQHRWWRCQWWCWQLASVIVFCVLGPVLSGYVSCSSLNPWGAGTGICLVLQMTLESGEVSHCGTYLLRVGFLTPGGGAFTWDVGLLSSRLLGTDLSSTASPLEYARCYVFCSLQISWHSNCILLVLVPSVAVPSNTVSCPTHVCNTEGMPGHLV